LTAGKYFSKIYHIIMKKLTIIGDADGLIAFINPQDASNRQANKILAFLEEQKATLYYPTTTIAETITALVRKHASPPLARQIVEQCKAGNILFIPVDQAVITTAITFYNPEASKYNTFFDAVVAAVAKLTKADAIFSFDKWYNKETVAELPGLSSTCTME
jgi:predicted nucleic acid-binding protein